MVKTCAVHCICTVLAVKMSFACCAVRTQLVLMLLITYCAYRVQLCRGQLCRGPEVSNTAYVPIVS